MVRQINRFLARHYDRFTILSNILIALGMVGFSLLGAFSNLMTITALGFWGTWIAFLYFLGKGLDGQLEDIQAEKDGEKCNEGDGAKDD